jgi:hypothetical protein
MNLEEDLAWTRKELLAAQAEAAELATQLEQAQAVIEQAYKLAQLWAILRTHGSAATELRHVLKGDTVT